MRESCDIAVDCISGRKTKRITRLGGRPDQSVVNLNVRGCAGEVGRHDGIAREVLHTADCQRVIITYVQPVHEERHRFPIRQQRQVTDSRTAGEVIVSRVGSGRRRNQFAVPHSHVQGCSDSDEIGHHRGRHDAGDEAGDGLNDRIRRNSEPGQEQLNSVCIGPNLRLRSSRIGVPICPCDVHAVALPLVT